MENLEFEDFLRKKNIDVDAFKDRKPDMYIEWVQLFSKVHPESFVAQKKFLINAIRREFLLKKFNL
jgi:hypothetical protein